MSEALLGKVNTHSRPSQLRITDMRIANLRDLPFKASIIRLDTNQGLSGYGEVRDGASATFALMLKSRLVGENPCNVDKLFRKIKQFGYHGRQGGGGLRRRDGADGFGGQGLRRARVYAGGWQV